MTTATYAIGDRATVTAADDAWSVEHYPLHGRNVLVTGIHSSGQIEVVDDDGIELGFDVDELTPTPLFASHDHAEQLSGFWRRTNIDDRGVVGRNIRARRMEIDMSQGELARRLGIDSGFLCRIETGVAATPNWVTVQAARILVTTEHHLRWGECEEVADDLAA